MLLGRNYWHTGYRLFAAPPGDQGGGGGEESDLTDEQIAAIPDLGDAGQKALRDQRDRRKAERDRRVQAEAQAADLQKQLDAAAREKAQRDADAASQAERDREAKGEFEQLARDRERERDQIKADMQALQERFDALNTAAQAIVKTDFEALPEEIREVYPGEADDPVAMLAFIPKGKKIAERMAGGTQNNSQEIDGAKPNPKANGAAVADAKVTDEQAARVNQARYQ